ncbi:MAG: hypothetical protein A3K03_11660 [Bdellovibrionales bacterium RIFOXYD1_FULL_44_7]|nr:MAG: hypothetical protein A3K03_11660 [Bdellovibrionales bacterium RIFOXYD1_FULL_44_7]
MRTTVEIRLLGQRITLKSEGSEDFVNEVIDLVSKKIANAERRGKNAAAHHVALLGLLDLAEDYIAAKRRLKEHKDMLEAKSQELTRLVEAEFK